MYSAIKVSIAPMRVLFTIPGYKDLVKGYIASSCIGREKRINPITIPLHNSGCDSVPHSVICVNWKPFLHIKNPVNDNSSFTILKNVLTSSIFSLV